MQVYCGVLSVQNVNQLPPRRTWKSTLVTPAGSVALAVIVTLPLTRALFTGLATEVTGPSVSTRLPVWAVEASVLPARSVTTARKS